MTNKEILERAGRIMQSLDRIHIAAALECAAEHYEPEIGSVEVRIAVATNNAGDWYAYGESNLGDADAIEEAAGNINENGIEVTIVTADIPRRQIPTVTGTVEPVDDPEATV